MISVVVLKALFVFVLCLGWIYFLTAIRRADWHSVAFASASVYFLPGLMGVTKVPGEELPLDAMCYIIMTMLLSATLISAYLVDIEELAVLQRSRIEASGVRTLGDGALIGDGKVAVAATLVQLVGCLYAIFASGHALLALDKHEMVKTFGVFHLVWLMGAPSAVILSVFYKRYGLALLNLVSVLFILFIGSRNQLAIAVIGSAAIILGRRGGTPLIKHQKTCCSIFLFVCFIFLYKQCYIAVKSGDLVEAKARVESRWMQAFMESEPVAIQHILNVVVREGYHRSASVGLSDAVLSNIWMNSSNGSVAFGDIATDDLFGDMGYGMASNIWAEMYAYGGLGGVFLFVFVYLLVLRSGNAIAIPVYARLFFVCFMPWWCFYIYRNDVCRMLSFAKQIAFLLVAVFFVKKVIDCFVYLYGGLGASCARGFTGRGCTSVASRYEVK